MPNPTSKTRGRLPRTADVIALFRTYGLEFGPDPERIDHFHRDESYGFPLIGRSPLAVVVEFMDRDGRADGFSTVPESDYANRAWNYQSDYFPDRRHDTAEQALLAAVAVRREFQPGRRHGDRRIVTEVAELPVPGAEPNVWAEVRQPRRPFHRRHVRLTDTDAVLLAGRILAGDPSAWAPLTDRVLELDLTH